MSYDLYGYRFRSDMTATEVERMLRDDDPDEHAQPLTRDELGRLADALMEVEPSAERIDEEEFVEIDTERFQVVLEDGGATITIPHHGVGAEGSVTMEQALACAEVLTRVGGLVVWDPQTESIVGADGYDRDRASRSFRATSELLVDMVAADRTAPEPPPRWMFWRRRRDSR